MKYHIAAVARMTDLSVDVIRSWERRYKIVEPQRDESGFRVYGDDDVLRLNLARAATELGHPIRRVARMPNEELEALLETPPAHSDGHGAAVDRVMGAVKAGDAELAQQILASAALLLSPPQLVLDVLAPVLREAGLQWEAGRVGVWQEHLLSTLVRNTAAAVPRSTLPGTALLFATPPFELHEFGITLASILAGAYGHKTHNLGPNVPVDELAAAARRLLPSVVVMGMTRASAPIDEAVAYVSKLDEKLPASVQIWIGGPPSTQVAAAVNSPRVLPVVTLEEFQQLIAGSRALRAPRSL